MKRLWALILAALMILSVCAAAAETYTAGDYVYFGTYDQDGNKGNGGERIRWLVLRVEGDKLFLLSEMGLARHRFHDRSNGTMWAGSELRGWLNGEFLNAAFSGAEQASIMTTRVEDTVEHNYAQWTTANRYGDVTFDKVFLLSYAEARSLLSQDQRFCEPSRSTVNSNVYIESHNGKKTTWYWLRTSAYRNNAGVVAANGAFDTSYIHHPYGVVRPALWVDAAAVSAY